MDTSANNTLTVALSKEDLIKQLNHLGLQENMTVEVHCALSKVGYVIGGASVFVDALKEVLAQGTIVMPSQASNNTEPLNWVNPPIARNLVEKVRANTPGYDIYNSDIHKMGSVALDLRSRKDTYHSYHPSAAFMAWGRDAKYLMKNQPLNFPFAYRSPLDKMYQMENTKILLIGVDYDSCTGMHFGECISEMRSIVLNGGAVKKDGETIWKKYLDYDMNSEEFLDVGKLMEKGKKVKIGKLGGAVCKFMDFRTATDITKEYFVTKYGRK